MSTHIENINNHDGGVINIHHLEHKVPKQLTIKLGKNTIIGREKELKEIDKLLNNSNFLLLINGIGGIGKSTIASYYLHSQKDKLDYYGFFEGIDSFLIELRIRLDIKAEKEQEAFMEALIKLSALKGNKLLVIDDVKNIEENQDKIEKILALENSGYKILLTSREEIEDITKYELDVLSIDDAKRLFNSIYEVKDEVLLEEILEYLDCHAFFVEMTAKTLKSKKTLTPELIKEKFENGEFSTIKRKRKESFNNYLNELFSFDELDDEEILMLKQLSVLPSIEIEFDFLQEIFKRKDDEEFEEILDYLCEKGWLSSFDNRYKLHQIIKEYILFRHIPIFKEIEIIIDGITKLVSNSIDIQDIIKNKNNIFYFENLSKLLERLEIENKKVSDFYSNLGNIYRFLGFWDKSELIYQKSLKIKERIFGEKHVSVATLYNSLSDLYVLMGKYEESEIFIKKALKIREEVLGLEHIDTSVSYFCLARLYRSRGMYKESESFYFKVLKIQEKLYEENNPNIAISYTELGELYFLMRFYTKSEFFYKKALKINEHNSYAIAISYNGLALLYTEIEEYKKAISFYNKAFIIFQESFGIEHSSTVSIFNNLGLLYEKKKDYKKAEEFHLKALKIREKILDNRHIDIALSYNNLASVLAFKKDFEKAFDYINKAVNIWTETLPVNHQYLIEAKSDLKAIKSELDKSIMMKKVNTKKPKRNDLCPCNSAKKYKKCCGKNS